MLNIAAPGVGEYGELTHPQIKHSFHFNKNWKLCFCAKANIFSKIMTNYAIKITTFCTRQSEREDTAATARAPTPFWGVGARGKERME
ncbi:hypothetical protein KB20921_19320 [Edwardsiella ictaluri]|nr:hypothetical protein KH20906_19090 [Edwardsiella ictaluri]BEI02671.1 hypothetical protein KB20921_19320 [Edwardsiella ictaluri]BEI06139.1 hypothetical protein KH201010_19250 [Edwardsiella ictaluri]BEI09593.1 hypothetical protein STU22726_19240 [Edwardsiella ictaluri]BEI13072.1 hypothetical protein STU22816_19250 [Edwardsiella ictaluri]